MFEEFVTFFAINSRAVPDSDFEAGSGFRIIRLYKKPDPDIRPDIRLKPDSGYPVLFFNITFLFLALWIANVCSVGLDQGGQTTNLCNSKRCQLSIDINYLSFDCMV